MYPLVVSNNGARLEYFHLPLTSLITHQCFSRHFLHPWTYSVSCLSTSQDLVLSLLGQLKFLMSIKSIVIIIDPQLPSAHEDIPWTYIDDIDLISTRSSGQSSSKLPWADLQPQFVGINFIRTRQLGLLHHIGIIQHLVPGTLIISLGTTLNLFLKIVLQKGIRLSIRIARYIL